MTVYEAEILVRNRLRQIGIEDAESEAGLICETVTGASRARLMMERTRELTASESERLNEILQKREERIPIQYILGEQEFMGLTFCCSEDCLIPRQDTELIAIEAQKAIDEIAQKAAKTDGIEMIDLCTGTGCIIISLVSYAQEKGYKILRAEGSDISEAAVELARRNAEKNDTKVTFICSDMFKNIHGQFDLITANPPYIGSKKIETLMPEVKDHEPRLALDGGEDGLALYRRLIPEAVGYLRDGGFLIVEIGDEQGEAVKNLFEAAGFVSVVVMRDLAGYHRLVMGRK